MKKLFSVVFVVCICTSIFAQSFERDIRDALKTKPVLDLRLDSRHSFINQSGVNVFGVKGGIEFDRKLRFGLGFNILSTPLRTSISYLENGILKTSDQARLVFYHVSPYTEYVFYKGERWEVSIPVQFGIGNSYYTLNTDNGRINRNRQFILTYEPAITAQYKILKYFGLGFGVGYRLMIVDNKAVKESFNSPVYIFRFKIFFGEIYKDLLK
ncbi:hypothetical protein GYB57_00630 [bacterium]|nr:hypothetical protein [bacterium]